MRALRANGRHNAMPFMEENVLNSALWQFMQSKTQWSGTATQLYKELHKIPTREEVMNKSFPKGANFLTRELNKSITTLKQFGIHYSTSNSSSHRNRIITISYSADSIDMRIQGSITLLKKHLLAHRSAGIWTKYRLRENTG